MVDEKVGSAVPIFMNEENNLDEKLRKQVDQDFTLKSAGQQARRIKEGKQSEGSLNLMEKMAISQELRYLEEQASDRASRTLRYEGAFNITLLSNAFERTPKLSAQYPLDPVTKRISVAVPIEGSIYEITLKQAEEIYQQGRR